MWQQYAKCFMQSENSDLKGLMIPFIWHFETVIWTEDWSDGSKLVGY